MAVKLQYYSELAEQAVGQLMESQENWTAYLDTASRLYKYPFHEQVMIYTQRPDAVAVAPIEMWNKKMNRYIRYGSKGIALIDNIGEKPRVRYVFDYADTVEGYGNAKRPFIWQMKQEYEAPLYKRSQIFTVKCLNKTHLKQIILRTNLSILQII